MRNVAYSRLAYGCAEVADRKINEWMAPFYFPFLENQDLGHDVAVAIIWRGYGFEDVHRDFGVDPDDAMKIASLSFDKMLGAGWLKSAKKKHFEMLS